MRVQRVQLFFQTPGFFQDFRFPEHKESTLRVPDVCDEPHVFRRLFGRYFCQIFDLRAFRPVLVQLIHFSFYVSLRAWKWPFSRAVLFSWFLYPFLRFWVRFCGFLERFSLFLAHFPPIFVHNLRNFVRFRPGNGRIAYTLSNLPCARRNAGKQALRQQRFGPFNHQVFRRFCWIFLVWFSRLQPTNEIERFLIELRLILQAEYNGRFRLGY